MKQETSVQIVAAVKYLAAKNPSALRDLDEPTPVIGRGLCIWQSFRKSELAFSLPPLAKGIRL